MSLRVQSSIVMKNCEPFVFGPELAIANAPSVYSPFTVFVAELVAGAAGAGALRAAALDHEVGDDAVERQAVVEALAGEADEVVHRVRRELRVEVGDDRAAVGVDRGAVDLAAVDLVLGLARPRGLLQVTGACGVRELLAGLDRLGEQRRAPGRRAVSRARPQGTAGTRGSPRLGSFLSRSSTKPRKKCASGYDGSTVTALSSSCSAWSGKPWSRMIQPL